MPDSEDPVTKRSWSRRLNQWLVPAIILLMAAGIVLLITGNWNVWANEKRAQKTDDAYLQADVTPLSTKVAGLVASVAVSDYQTVKSGDLLVQLQDDDFRAQVRQAEAAVVSGDDALINNQRQKELQDARILQADEGIRAAEADIAAGDAGIKAANSAIANARSGIDAAKADAERTGLERKRQEALFAAESATRQTLEQAVANQERFHAQLASREADLAAATAQLLSRRADLARARARLGSAKAELEAQKRQRAVLDSQELLLHADLSAKRAALTLAQTNLGYTRIIARLSRLAKFDFPLRLNEVTHSYFERMASIEQGQQAADMKAVLQTPPDAAALARLSASPSFNARLRTTCVATMLSAGHAENALPQSATAVVNCRILPNDTPAEVERTLKDVLADPQITISPMGAASISPVSTLDPKVVAERTAVAASIWPGTPIIPGMGTGATDGKYLRIAGIPTYGVSGIFTDENDVRAHGRDERILVKSFYDALDFMYKLMRALGK